MLIPTREPGCRERQAREVCGMPISLFVCQPSPRSGDLNERSLSTTVSHCMHAGELAGMVCIINREIIERVVCSVD